jgi:hypothetical protein
MMRLGAKGNKGSGQDIGHCRPDHLYLNMCAIIGFANMYNTHSREYTRTIVRRSSKGIAQYS